MKVKYLFDDGELTYEGNYNVFALQVCNTKEKKLYISEHDATGNFYIAPYAFDAFEIIDTKISKFWECGSNEFGEICIGVPEIFNIKNFWEKYYDDNSEVNNIVNFYYKVGKDDLFNP
ncbi:hypothetical protein CSA08_01375 [Candidatus Gracilibacteria bacterium]|nr:MAG: hypothetical protein CSA08_01375 [Candidatus Gracilibacteria bacterium]